MAGALGLPQADDHKVKVTSYLAMAGSTVLFKVSGTVKEHRGCKVVMAKFLDSFARNDQDWLTFLYLRQSCDLSRWLESITRTAGHSIPRDISVCVCTCI